MAKLNGALLSESAHGSLSKTLTYSHRQSGQQVRRYNLPGPAVSGAQRGQRRLTEFLIAHWQNMTASQKADWASEAAATGGKLPGFQYFLHKAQRNLPYYHGLCGYWHFNEIVNSQVRDLSGNENHGTLQPMYPADAPTLTTSVRPKMGKALTFDGLNDHIRSPFNAHAILKEQDFSVDFWVFGRKYAAGIVAGVGSPVAPLWYIRTENEILNRGSLRVGIGSVSLESVKFYDVNNWDHVTVTFDVSESRCRFYAGGSFKGSTLFTGWESKTYYDGDIWMGRRVSTYFQGKIDEICIYNRVLSSSEIKTRHDFASQIF